MLKITQNTMTDLSFSQTWALIMSLSRKAFHVVKA